MASECRAAEAVFGLRTRATGAGAISHGCQQAPFCVMLEAMRRFAILFVLVVTAGLSGCDSRRKVDSLTPEASPALQPSRQQAPAGEATPVEDGRSIFVATCIGCHGRNADGDTASGRAWHVPDLRSAQVQALSDEQLLQVMRTGKGRMPAWNGTLTETELAHTLAYIRSLK